MTERLAEIRAELGRPISFRDHEVTKIRDMGRELLAEVDRLRGVGQRLRQLVDQQANDDGLWFIAEHISEAYLQQELRRLHTAVEEALAALEAKQ